MVSLTKSYIHDFNFTHRRQQQTRRHNSAHAADHEHGKRLGLLENLRTKKHVKNFVFCEVPQRQAHTNITIPTDAMQPLAYLNGLPCYFSST